MLVKAVDQRAHTIVPQLHSGSDGIREARGGIGIACLDDSAVERSQDPWALGMKRKALHTVRLRERYENE